MSTRLARILSLSGPFDVTEYSSRDGMAVQLTVDGGYVQLSRSDVEQLLQVLQRWAADQVEYLEEPAP